MENIRDGIKAAMNRDAADNEIVVQAEELAANTKEAKSGSEVSAQQNTVDEKSSSANSETQNKNNVDLPYTSESTHFSTH
ncbi:hypothetical protein Ddc_13100 [Ditylenchus destructor]|nr:hypothetical protein Ddc_13100 [Ditylenchus destructor]